MVGPLLGCCCVYFPGFRAGEKIAHRPGTAFTVHNTEELWTIVPGPGPGTRQPRQLRGLHNETEHCNVIAALAVARGSLRNRIYRE